MMSLPASSRPTSLAEARELVEKISDDRGYLPEEELNSLDAKLRKRIVDMMLKKDQLSGSSVITLAKNLYSSNTRFVFELLQNTDDNEYAIATSRGVEPYVSFKVFTLKIVLECNEDGFTKENLIAICDIGKSSKIGLQGYIGEKGIGFKSVFMAAYKVHIQSGHFSFSFSHRHGDSGMGMISPVWEDPDTSLANGITRVTLFLHDTGSASEIQNRHQQIVQQFHEIQDTHLLFLKKIRRIHIIFAHKNEEDPTTTTLEVAKKSQGGRLILRKFSGDNSAKETYYHVTRNTAYGLPKSENRTYSDSVEASSEGSAAEIILAFPLDSNSVPIIRTQQIFAFLPIRDMGFKFLIHSDFVTQANRQDILITSARNLALVSHIATTFANAMQELCQDARLRFEWMKYLPQDGNFPWDGYWKSVIASMKEKIAAKSLMRSRSRGPLKRIDQLRSLAADTLDDDGTPLLQDISPHIYLSRGYDRSITYSYLKDWGLQMLNMQEFLDRVEADLTRTASRLKSPLSPQMWHSRVAVLLNRVFEEWMGSHQDRLRNFSLIPIQGGRWISAQQSSFPLVSPTVNGANIPNSLNLNIVDKTAASNTERMKLFMNLGTKQLSVGNVRQLILERYPSVVNRARLFGTATNQAEISLSHIAFLYLTHDVADRKRNEYRFIRLLTPEGLLVAPKSQDVYIKDDHKYGVKSLLENLPRFSVAFLAPIYLEKQPKPVPGCEPKISWPSWLRESLGVLSRPVLVANGALTDLFQHIIEHNSNSLLGILQYYWNDIRKTVHESPEIKQEIGNVVLTMKGCRVQLSDSFLPLPELKARALEYLDQASMDKFPFLDLSDTLEPNDTSKWIFLHDTFKVHKHDNIEFYLNLLSVLACQYPKPNLDTTKKVYALYEALYQKTRSSIVSGIRQAQQQAINAYIQNDRSKEHSKDGLVLLPSRDFHTWTWTQPSKCRWDAPSTVISMQPVSYLLDRFFINGDIDRTASEQFFQRTLQIGNCTCTDLIDELKYHATLSRQDKGTACNNGHYSTQAAVNVYKHLKKLMPSLEISEKQKLVAIFQNTALIFVANSWYKIEDCLWSSATDIEGKVILNGLYPKLKDFFVDVLGVTTLTLQMAYDKLERLGGSNESVISEVKSTWIAFNSLLSQENNKPDPKPLLKGRLFPVKYADGHVELRSATCPFAIVDRKSHGVLFLGKAMILDYSFEEAHQLQETIKWAGIDIRYTSVAVKEVSAIVGGSKTVMTNVDRDLKPKAHGLCRIATHFKSPKARANPESLYKVLKNVEVFETDGIATELHLQQGNVTVSVRTSQSNLHLETHESVLRVYVPRDQKQQQLCYTQTLPQRLYNWIMGQNGHNVPTTESTTCVNIVMQILNVSRDNIEAVLEGSGIAEVSFPDEYEAGEGTSQDNKPSQQASLNPVTAAVSIQMHLANNDEENSNSNNETDIEDPGTRSSYVLPTASLHASDVGDVDDAFRLQSPHISNRHLHLSQAPQSQRSSELSPTLPVRTEPASLANAGQLIRIPELGVIEQAVTSDYVALLSRVIETARHSALPNKSTIRTARLDRAIRRIVEYQDSDKMATFYASNKLERDKMIGAAGELYVFELLSKLQSVLPGFGRMNWMSTIRKYVSQHRDYSDMDPWNGKETTDIVYWDHTGTLTGKLIDLGYLDTVKWTGSCPTYYIEVKTTTGPCETAFYMSKSQFDRMQTKSNVGSKSHADIYVIFRVSNLTSDSIDLAIYLDPESMRRAGDLDFTTTTYSVTPGQGGSPAQ